jgi:hypothetical protein
MTGAEHNLGAKKWITKRPPASAPTRALAGSDSHLRRPGIIDGSAVARLHIRPDPTSALFACVLRPRVSAALLARELGGSCLTDVNTSPAEFTG